MNRQSDGTSFHMENFKRRSRYTLVFVLLILAFGLITVLNINTGNVHISLSEIVNILLKKATDTKEYSIIWKIRAVPSVTDGISQIASDIKTKKVIFNLQGQRISAPKQGVYIINDKKVDRKSVV